MTALADAVAGLADALPQAQARTTIPDTDGTLGHTKPGSRPPWNPQVANALYDALEGVRRLETAWRTAAAGRPVVPYPAAATGRLLASLLRLAHARDDDEQQAAARELRRWTGLILCLPAIDEQERAEKVEAECPYCHHEMLWLWRRAGKVACTRFGDCWDGNGMLPTGLVGQSQLNGDSRIYWSDGHVT